MRRNTSHRAGTHPDRRHPCWRIRCRPGAASGRPPLPSQRRATGWTLLLVGAVTTVPLAVEVFGRLSPEAHGWGPDWNALKPGLCRRRRSYPREPDVVGQDVDSRQDTRPGKGKPCPARRGRREMGTGLP